MVTDKMKFKLITSVLFLKFKLVKKKEEYEKGKTKIKRNVSVQQERFK